MPEENDLDTIRDQIASETADCDQYQAWFDDVRERFSGDEDRFLQLTLDRLQGDLARKRDRIEMLKFIADQMKSQDNPLI